MSEGRDGGAPLGGGAAVLTAGGRVQSKVAGSRDLGGGEERDNDSEGRQRDACPV